MATEWGLSHEVDHLDLWTHGVLSGCAFAARAAAKGGIAWFLDRGAGSDGLERAIDDAADLNAIAGLVMPTASTEREIAKLLRSLAAAPSGRWSVFALHTGHERPGEASVEVLVKTRAGLLASVMGLAPLPSMPVTRRAPYTVLVAWAGGRAAGPFDPSKSPEGEVGVIDAPVDPKKPKGLDADKRKELAKKTRDRTRALLGSPDEEVRKRIYRMTFCLPVDVIATELPGIVPRVVG